MLLQGVRLQGCNDSQADFEEIKAMSTLLQDGGKELDEEYGQKQ